MKYFGIQTPEKEDNPSIIWWIASSEHEAWNLFFTFPREGKHNAYRAPLYEAQEAYKAIGYKCVEVEVKVK